MCPSTLRAKPASSSAVSSAFRTERTAQNGNWPDNQNSRLNCTSRLGSVTLSDLTQRWGMTLDSRCALALEAGGKMIVFNRSQHDLCHRWHHWQARMELPLSSRHLLVEGAAIRRPRSDCRQLPQYAGAHPGRRGAMTQVRCARLHRRPRRHRLERRALFCQRQRKRLVLKWTGS